MMTCEVRVHDARIATFGERVEDFFQLTDRRNNPLGETQQQRLWHALVERIGPFQE
jgi:[protein-PII] uridylyltransferase